MRWLIALVRVGTVCLIWGFRLPTSTRLMPGKFVDRLPCRCLFRFAESRAKRILLLLLSVDFVPEAMGRVALFEEFECERLTFVFVRDDIPAGWIRGRPD